MSDDSERERLRQLEERIAAARSAREGPARKDEVQYSAAGLAWRMVTELVAGLGIGLLIGLGLDALFGTQPFLMIVFLAFGFAAGIRVMMRTAAEIGKDVGTANAEAHRKDKASRARRTAGHDGPNDTPPGDGQHDTPPGDGQHDTPPGDGRGDTKGG